MQHKILAICICLLYGVSVSAQVTTWTTTGDEKVLLQKGKQTAPTATPDAIVTIDPEQRFQTVDGFGYTLTGGSAQLIMAMSENARKKLLHELFSSSGIRISYVRISVGASDLNPDVFTYDDLPEGQTDTGLLKFSLAKDGAAGTGLIPVLKQILAIQPQVKILATPWTAPTWMKDNRKSMGGKLLPAYYRTYANYLVKYIRAMKAEGIVIDAMTPQNEPLHGGNNPSMVMLAEEQSQFIRDYLGPVFRAEGITTKIIAYDHNCNKPEYPLTVLNDEKARPFVDGSAFHLYEGDISALSVVKKAYPEKNLYFTEQWTGAKGEFDGDLHWHMKNVIIGSMRNWSRVALEWNLANDLAYGPHTPGGCTECKGALTISADQWHRNVAYYIIAHASKWVLPGSVRIGSESNSLINQVAFMRPDGKTVLIMQNEQSRSLIAEIRTKKNPVYISLMPRSVVTVVF
ncbi:MAG: glycoside hydrolase family 30 beta sandwich domain-containing protein [Chitinophagaceae bacterium]